MTVIENGETKTKIGSFERDIILSKPTVVICSGGRGELLLHQLVDEFYHQGLMFAHFSIVPPDLEFAQPLLAELRECMFAKPDRYLLDYWMTDPKEGRVGDVIYPNTRLITSIAQDLITIAARKLRPLAFDLLACHRHGLTRVKRLYWGRDSGQIVGLNRRPLLHYQSHPGPEKERQKAQVRELVESEYVILMTATVICGGTFSTATKEDIYRQLSLLLTTAYGAQPYADQVAKTQEVLVAKKVQFGIFRLKKEEDLIESGPHKDVPGGLDFQSKYVMDNLDLYVHNGQTVQTLSDTHAPLSFKDFTRLKEGKWWFYDQAKYDLDGYDFQNVRRGTLSRQVFTETIKEIGAVFS